MSIRIPLMTLAGLLFAPFLCAQGTTDGPMEVVFTETTTRADLERIRKEAAERSIEFQITNADFHDGRLRAIAYSVKTAKGSGTASGEIKPDTRIGFRYDPTPGAEVPFSIGNLSAPPEPSR